MTPSGHLKEDITKNTLRFTKYRMGCYSYSCERFQFSTLSTISFQTALIFQDLISSYTCINYPFLLNQFLFPAIDKQENPKFQGYRQDLLCLNQNCRIYLLACEGLYKLMHQRACSKLGMAEERLECSYEGLEFVLRGQENPFEDFLQGSTKIRPGSSKTYRNKITQKTQEKKTSTISWQKYWCIFKRGKNLNMWEIIFLMI